MFPLRETRYNLALHGPDADDELGIVRSRSPDVTGNGSPEDGKASGKGGGGKRGGVDVEALKREAKMERELVQIEKLMAERAAKRQRRDEGDPVVG